jgi:putative transposase
VPERPNPYRGHRFPREVIAHAVRLYLRFALSFRDVEELLAERGVQVSYETVRRWVATFGASYAAELRRREAGRGRPWHLDEMATRVGGRLPWRWRAVGEHGQTLDVLLQARRDTGAAERCFRRLLAVAGGVPPERVTTDKFGSYAAALGRLPELARVEHSRVRSAVRCAVRCTSRVEHARQPTRLRGRITRRFKVARIGPAVPRCVHAPRQPVPAGPPSARGRGVPRDDARARDHVARGRRPAPRVTPPDCAAWHRLPTARLTTGKLTEPRRLPGRGSETPSTGGAKSAAKPIPASRWSLSFAGGGRGIRTDAAPTNSPPMTNGPLMSLSTLRAGAAGSPDVAPEETRHRGPRGYLLLTAGGWLLFGVAMIIGSLDEQPWPVVLSIMPVYVLISFLLSLLLDRVYDRLGVGPASFSRALTISVVGSCAAGALWAVAYHYHRTVGAGVLHSMLVGAPLPLPVWRRSVLDGALVNGALPLLGWSLVRLGLQYNTALREQREQALRAVAAARDAQLQMLAYQLNPHFLFNTLNSIRALINEDRQRARDMVTALSGYLRYALMERPLHVALLEEEVGSVRGYLAIEQVRFEERLDVRVDVEPAAAESCIARRGTCTAIARGMLPVTPGARAGRSRNASGRGGELLRPTHTTASSRRGHTRWAIVTAARPASFSRLYFLPRPAAGVPSLRQATEPARCQGRVRPRPAASGRVRPRRTPRCRSRWTSTVPNRGPRRTAQSSTPSTRGVS